jgi:phosphoserine phosphatase
MSQDDGSYAGFDPEEFTSRSGGKAEAVRHIRVSQGHRLRHVCVVDGI